MHRGQLGVALLAAVALASHSGCNDPDCPEGTRKIGISCVPLRAASDGGSSLEGGGDGGSGAAVMGDVRNGPGVDASASHGGQAEGGAAEPDGVVDGGNPTPGKVGGNDAAIASGCSGPTNECGGCTAIEPAHAKGQPCSNGGQGACDLPGAYACLAGTTVCSAPSATPIAEICDGKDNDCNGVVDDGVMKNACGGCTNLTHAKGSPCGTGVGDCGAVGTYECTPTKETTACTAAPGAPTSEVCDGKDNDCNGLIDDGATNACGGSCGDPVPTEVCDGKDNDCNGLVDDAIGRGGLCTLGTGACHASGAFICKRGAVSCDAPVLQPKPEVCANNIDDDCDGMTDELESQNSPGPGWFLDCNGDGLGNPAIAVNSCGEPARKGGCKFVTQIGTGDTESQCMAMCS